MNWEDARCFLAVAHHGSLSAGAASLGLSVATAGRRIDALERDLGLQLLHRRPSGTVLSQHGRAVLSHFDQGARALAEAERAAVASGSGYEDAPVHVAAPEPVVADVLAPAIGELAATAPAVRVDLVVATNVTNLNKREADLAVRMIRPTGDTLLCRKLPRIPMGCFAASSYLRRRRLTSARLARERWLLFDDAYGEIIEYRWAREHDLLGSAVLLTTSTNALLTAARSGAGIAILPRFLAERHGLRPVAAPPLPDRTPWLVFHRELRRVQKIRRVRDWIAASFAQALSGRRERDAS